MSAVTTTPVEQAGLAARALADPARLFTRDQLVWILAALPGLDYQAGFDAGYWQRVREENERAATDEPVFSFGEWLSASRRDALRAETDRQARERRPDDFPGGLPKPAGEFPGQPGRRRYPPRGPQPWLSPADREFCRRWLAAEGGVG